MRKLKLLMAICALIMGGVSSVWGQASYNHTFTTGVVPAAGGNYFLYNIGAKQFLTNGLNYGTRATVDNSGRVLTLATATKGFSIYTDYISFNNRATRKAGYLTTNGYVDTGTNDADWVFTPVEVDGYTNAFTINSGENKFLFFDSGNTDPGCPVNVGANTGNNYSYWLLIPKSTREGAGDYSHYLINTQINACWEYKTWGGSETWNDNAVLTPGGLVSNRCAEKYHATSDIYQEIKEVASLPEGRYKFYAQGFWRQDGSAAGPVIYANDDKNTILPLTGTENSMNDASNSFNEGKYVNSVETFKNSDQLKVGIKISDGSQWVIFDNFVLDYLGQCVMDYAVPLPDGGAMAADTWYYFDIAAAADNYTATATNLGNIICVTDGYTLTSANTGTVTLTAEDNSLSIQRYYVKSSSTNKLVVDVASFSYELGSITAQNIAEGSYIQSLTTFVLTYGNAATNDGDASLAVIGTPVATLKKNGSAVATGMLSADNAAKTLTATFSAVSLTLNSSDYSIEIPAGAFGYAGQSVNTAITVNFNTPVFADGDYYLKNKNNGAYFAAGNNYMVHAITNNIGHKVTLTAQPSGKYTINTYIFNGANSHFLNGEWCDGASAEWSFVISDEYYQINDGTNNLTAADLNENMTLTNGTGDNTKWSLLTPAQWKSQQVARLDAAALNNGVDATFYIAAPNFNRNDNNENAKWNGSPGISGWSTNSSAANYNAQKYNTTPFDIYQEITGMKPGFYKVTMQGFYRNGTTDDRNAKLYANDYSVELVNIRSANVTVKDDDVFTTANGEYYVPNTQTEAAKAFNNNYYNNELMFTVGDDGNLRIGVKKETGASADWTVIDNFQLTYYGVLEEVTINETSNYTPTSMGANVTLKRTLSNTNWNTFVVPFDIDNATLTAKFGTVQVAEYSETAVGDNSTVNFTKMATPAITANKPVLLKTSTAPASVTFNGVVIKTGDAKVAGSGNYDFVGSYNASTFVTTGNYYLSANKLYKSAKDNGTFIKGTRAYIEAKSPSARIASFSIDDETTGINDLTPATSESEDVIYNLNGQKVQKANKGLYIQNGKKVVVK